MLEQFLHKKKSEELQLNTQTAILVILYFSIKADSSESKEEMELLQYVVSGSPIFNNNSYKEDKKLIYSVKNYCDSSSIDLLDRAISILDKKYKKIAFFLAVEMLFVDSVITSEENRFINELASKCEISQSSINAAIEVFSTLYIL